MIPKGKCFDLSTNSLMVFFVWILGLKCPSLKIGQVAAKTKGRSSWHGKIKETYH